MTILVTTPVSCQSVIKYEGNRISVENTSGFKLNKEAARCVQMTKFEHKLIVRILQAVSFKIRSPNAIYVSYRQLPNRGVPTNVRAHKYNVLENQLTRKITNQLTKQGI